ncbi:MAG: hypothetical protein PVI66_12445 [Candidatus Aminicenantes bacterium]|jgi:hypothetical protein
MSKKHLRMNPTKALHTGIILAILGGAGIILGPMFDLTELVRPWSFILGFVFGIMSGVGAALTLFGLLEKRKLPS